MNKKFIFLAGFVLLVGLGVGYIVYAGGEEEPTASSTTPSEEAVAEAEPSPETTAEAPVSEQAEDGKYLAYSQDSFEKAEGDRVIFFHAPWCPQCRELDGDFTAAGAPDGYTVFKADFDSETSLKQKYGVTQQTTLVKVDKNGDLKDKYVAYDEPNLAAVKRDFLK